MSEVPQFPAVSRLGMIIAGGLLAVFAIAFAALVVLSGVRSMQGGIHISVGGVILVVVIGAVAYGLGILSWRLIANQPNRYGSIFGPLGWKISALLWSMASIIIAILIFHEHTWQPVGGLGGGIALSVGSWLRARNLQEKTPDAAL
jgi:hypothetical protein